jgi:hypothetical protein
MILPLLGERAGVRAVVFQFFSINHQPTATINPTTPHVVAHNNQLRKEKP